MGALRYLPVSVVLAVAMMTVTAVATPLTNEVAAAPPDIVAVEKNEICILRGGSSSVGALEDKGIEIIQEYEGFLLAAMTPEEETDARRLGFEVETIPDRTITGRGAFIFDTRFGEPAIPQRLSMDTSVSPDYDLYIVQFMGPVSQDWLAEVQGLGAALINYLPSYAFITEMDPDTVAMVSELRYVQWVGVYHPAYKISEGLIDVEANEVKTMIVLAPGKSPVEVLWLISVTGGVLKDSFEIDGQTRLVAYVSSTCIEQLATLPDVLWIEEVSERQWYNDDATWVLQSNVADSRTIFNEGLNGEGQIITVADGGIYTSHEMFFDPSGNTPGRKIYSYYVPTGSGGVLGDENGHGTHVSGTAAGDAPDGTTYLTYNKYDGNAYGAKLIVQDIGSSTGGNAPPEDFYNGLFLPSYQSGSRIHTNSWGGGFVGGDIERNTYTEYCAMIDDFVWDYDNYLILFAAGNSQEYYLNYYPYTGGISEEGSSKSVVTVGATKNAESANNMAYFDGYWSSARGTTEDGRIKPTVLAPGYQITSAQYNTVTGYVDKEGTSMATPAVAGAAALVREYFKTGMYGGAGFEPSSSLVRAMLINGASEINGLDTYGTDGDAANYYSRAEIASIDGRNCLRILKASDYDNDIPARIVSKQISMDYNSFYQVQMCFKVTSECKALQIINDGRALIELYADSMAIYDGTFMEAYSMTEGVWHTLVISYFVSEGYYIVQLDGVQFPDPFMFTGEARQQVEIGTYYRTSYKYYGEFYVDYICYLSGSQYALYEGFSADLMDKWVIYSGPAKDLQYPNIHQGWGRVNLDNCMWFTGDTSKMLYFWDEKTGLASTGKRMQFQVNVLNQYAPLKVSLAWNDYQGTPGAFKALVNDLDLTVHDPQGTDYVGNQFTGYNPAQSVAYSPNTYDRLNVEEAVIRLSPTTGAWKITVSANNIAYGPQPFALVVTGNFDDFTLLSDTFSTNELKDWIIVDGAGYVGLDSTTGMSAAPSLEVSADVYSSTSSARHYFEPQSGHMIIEYNAKATATPSPYACYLLFMHGDLYDYKLHFAFRLNSLYFMQDSGWVKLARYKADTWYSFQFDVDLTSGTYDIYINGKLKYADAMLRGTTADVIDNMYIWTVGSGGTTVWVDDLVVTR